MTPHRKAAKADKKSRNNKATRPETVRHGPSMAGADRGCVASGEHQDGTHEGGEQHTPHTSDQPRDAPSDLHEDRDAAAGGDADQLLRRPPRRRAAPFGPPLGDHVEATAD
jgi:hypothetical protein